MKQSELNPKYKQYKHELKFAASNVYMQKSLKFL